MPRMCYATALSLLIMLSHYAKAAGEPSSEYRVQWHLPRGRVFVQPGKKLALSLTVRDRLDKGVAGLNLRLSASNGSLSTPKDLGNGRYKTNYSMPDQRHPQAVILSALLPGLPPAWTVLRLWSKVALPVNTNKPHVQVTLKLGDRAYGPNRTNSYGKTTMDMSIGPGENQALAMAVDEFGNRSTKRISIPVPPVRHILGLADRNNLVADGVDSATIYLLAIKTDGSPADRATFLEKCDQGRLSKLERLQPGLYQIKYQTPAQTTKSESQVIISLGGHSKHEQTKLSFQLASPEPKLATPSETITPLPGQEVVSIKQVDQQSPALDPHHRPTRFSFGPSIGLISNFARLNSISISFDGIMQLPLGKPHIYLAVSTGFRFGNDADQVGPNQAPLETDLDVIPIHLSILYKISPRKRLTLYGGLGGGLELVRWTLSHPDDIKEKGQNAIPSLLTYFGAELRMSNQGALFVKLGYLYAYLTDSSPSPSTGLPRGSKIKGNVAGLEVTCGYRIYL